MTNNHQREIMQKINEKASTSNFKNVDISKLSNSMTHSGWYHVTELSKNVEPTGVWINKFKDIGPQNWCTNLQSCEMSQIWQICLRKNIGKFG